MLKYTLYIQPFCTCIYYIEHNVYIYVHRHNYKSSLFILKFIKMYCY